MRVVYLLSFYLFMFAFAASAAVGRPEIILPASGLVAKDLAVVINTEDPLSMQIGHYYQQRRNIPAENIIRIAFEPGKSVMHPGEFAVLEKQVARQTPKYVQAYALTWAAPYRVGCMSISSAFAFGYDRKFCAKGCKPTAGSIYAGSDSLQPQADFGIRPTMLIAAENLEQAKALIDRGVATDTLSLATAQKGMAYLITTPDKTRSVRNVYFPEIQAQLGLTLPVANMSVDSVQQATNVMFYFTGAKFVPDIESNQYLPGAMADHLTSTGGQLTDSHQMSALRWLEAGLTGSYGTVVEPCNLLAKFPNPLVAMRHYLSGASLIEAYWKSVATPGQGVFIGEPLAAPYRSYQLQDETQRVLLTSPVLGPGHYKILAADKKDGPFTLLHSGIELDRFSPVISLAKPLRPVYKIERLERFGERFLKHLIQ